MLLVSILIAIAVRRNAVVVASFAGPVASIYFTASIGAALYLLRTTAHPDDDLYAAAKIVAGVQAITLIVLAPLWVRPAEGLGGRMAILSLPLVFHCLVQTVRLAGPAAGDRMVGIVGIFVPKRMAPLVAAELRVLALGLFGWGRPPPDDGRSFTSSAVLQPLLLSVAALASIEIFVIHLVVGRWSHGGALALTSVGALMIVYMVGLARSLRRMPSLITPERLIVRLGHFRRVEIPYEAITTVRRSDRGEKAPAGSLDLAPMSAPNLIIGLKSERETVGLGGRVRRYTQIALRMDDAAAFERSLIARLGE
jgi:hypothetical protein